MQIRLKPVAGPPRRHFFLLFWRGVFPTTKKCLSCPRVCKIFREEPATAVKEATEQSPTAASPAERQGWRWSGAKGVGEGVVVVKQITAQQLPANINRASAAASACRCRMLYCYQATNRIFAYSRPSSSKGEGSTAER